MMENCSKPSLKNQYLCHHVAILRQYLRHYTGRDLVEGEFDEEAAAQRVYQAPFAVLSHNTMSDPIFNYANQTAQTLFAMPWDELVTLPSRLSAEPLRQTERAKLLKKVAVNGYVDHYSGVRISKTGRRFAVENAVVWNLYDLDKVYYGQAAMLDNWQFL